MIQLKYDDQMGRCVMHDDHGYCKLHREGIKPTEGTLAGCTPPDHTPIAFLTDAVAATWATKNNVHTVNLIVKAYIKYHSSINRKNN
jgi:hypothetical protein